MKRKRAEEGEKRRGREAVRGNQPPCGHADETECFTSAKASHDKKQVAKEQDDAFGLDIMLENAEWLGHVRSPGTSDLWATWLLRADILGIVAV